MTDNRTSISVEVAREIVRQGEMRLEASLALTSLGVTRATTLCGIFGGAAVALLAALLAYIGAPHHSARLIWAAGITTPLLFAASVLAAVAGASRDFMGVGAIPEKLRTWAANTYRTERRWATETELLETIAEQLDKTIAKNAQLLRYEGRLVNLSLVVALGSLAAGLLAYWVVPIF